MVDVAEPPDPLAGKVIANQYRLQSAIGAGAMGVVYIARQISVDRDVAVKILRRELATDEQLVRRFENESHIIGRLRHPNTLRLFDFQRTELGELFIVTELLSGSPLSRILHDGPIGVDRTLNIIHQVCSSLSEAHAAGIVHRDLKPDNIFIDRVGKDDVIKVLDFGIAKLTQNSPNLTNPNSIIGTPTYMSPEQARGEDVDHRSDIYALGVVLYHMLAGVPPFKADTSVGVLVKHIQDTPTPLLKRGVHISPSLDALVTAMLAKNRDARPQNIDEVRDRIGAAMSTSMPRGVSSPRNEPLLMPNALADTQLSRPRPLPSIPVWRRRAVQLGAVALLVAIAIVGTVASRSPSDQPIEPVQAEVLPTPVSFVPEPEPQLEPDPVLEPVLEPAPATKEPLKAKPARKKRRAPSSKDPIPVSF